VFLDEFGPLEFGGLGYASLFQSLLNANIAALYIVIREELVTRFAEEFPQLIFDKIDVQNPTPSIIVAPTSVPVKNINT
jgi:hypothetical protein